MEVYCTLLLTDGYLPGAQVLAHSLRDGGATRKLAVLVTQEFLSEATMKELKRIYDYIIPVERITNKSHGNLLMMDRLDLSSAFTKIHLWRMTQFSKIVYIDADVVALRAPEELFETKERFAAAPDIGWPDCFNSGVMVLTPDMGTYRGLLNLANKGISFDGADQGLLNEYFRNYHRLSFVYNVTPSGHYQYAPAYNHYRSNITMVHFIGANKPWAIGRYASQESSSSAYGELLTRWWAVWDAHYRPVTEQDPSLAWVTKGLGDKLTISQIERPNPMPTEYDPNFRREHTSFDEKPHDEPAIWNPPPLGGTPKKGEQQHHYQPQHYQPQGHQPQHHDQQQQQHAGSPPAPVFLPKEHVPYVPRDLPYNAYSQTQAPPSPPQYDQGPPPPPQQEQQHEQHHEPPRDQNEFGPYIHAPHPVNPHLQEQGRRFSQEIPNRIDNSLPLPPLPTIYEHRHYHHHHHQEPPKKQAPVFEAPMQQWDAGRFSPPPNSRPEASNWPSQVYANQWDQDRQDTSLFVPPRIASPPHNLHFEVPPKPQASPRPSPIFPWEHRDLPPATRVFAGDSPSPTLALSLPDAVDDEFETEEAADGYTIRGMAGWDSYPRTNAWDSIPSIERYVESFQRSTQPRKTVRKGDVTPNPQIRGADETIRTDGDETTNTTTTGLLPPEISVTPTPFKALRRGYRSHAMDDETKFPSAQGIPDQQHWDPLKSLEELRNAPGELLNRSPPSPQSLTRGSPRSPASSVLVSSSMPVPEKDFHITAYRKRHEMSISSSSKDSSVTGSPVSTRTYSSSATQTDLVELSDAGTQSDPEEIDAEIAAAVSVH